ncbi:hypothetical protein KMZ29_08110 [Bradyrhizobium sediminis]|uniref:Polysaccharide chain length determinant N-terminal domain-containing protein n=1 Tax=Bradyrhizobium sediminis TaxID=2840469 RepID=A0A975NI91_9BRAD|nr:hypothetical protein [Bradyrhizobium sediminis]QWG14614.1 hypothetical protein KMZ29_08110 [Bradyrhizobium sediminis]
MNTPLKFIHEKRPDFRFARSDYRAHYEDLVARIPPAIVRDGRIIVSLVAVALVLACIAIPLMPRKYSAEALIYPNLISREQEKVVALANVDGAALVTGEARLIRSDAILRAVAKRLGQDPKASTPRSWATRGLDWFRAAFLPETRNQSPFDRTVAMLRNKVVVTNDTRSYLISLSFTASSADEAAQVVNAFVTEYLRDKIRQRGLNKVNSAEAELRQQLAVYGEKHPKTLHAVAELDAERASLKAAMNLQDGDKVEVANDQSVKLAVPNHTPTSPKGLVILGLSLLSALLAGIGLAIWRDRRETERKYTASRPPTRRAPRQVRPRPARYLDNPQEGDREEVANDQSVKRAVPDHLGYQPHSQ